MEGGHLSNMSRATIIYLSAFGLIVGCVAFVLWPRGYRSWVITEVSQPFSVSVSAPIRPLGSGELFVIVEGQLDGEAILEVTSNRGRDRREIPLRGPQVFITTGSHEEWVDDLQVQYRPSTAKAGQLYVSLYCGTSFTPQDRERHFRISRNEQ
jgi:hypothetical protein